MSVSWNCYQQFDTSLSLDFPIRGAPIKTTSRLVGKNATRKTVANDFQKSI